MRIQAEWIVDLTTRADRDGKHAEYADRYDVSELRRANLKELDLQLDRGYRVGSPCGGALDLDWHMFEEFCRSHVGSLPA